MKKHRKTLRIGISMGDLNGIGPELIINTFKEQKIKELFTPIVYGSTRALNIYRKVLGVEKFSYNVVEQPNQAQPRKISVIDSAPEIERIDIGRPGPEGGLAAWKALKNAVKDLKEGEIDALVTLPIDKLTIQNDEFEFAGHTDYLAKAFGVKENLMLMVSEHLKVGLVTGHVAIKDVSNALNVELIVSKLDILAKSLKDDFNIDRPRIAVLGLNPHAGDDGLIGKEDKEKILRAIQQASNQKMLVFGPYPADGFFGAATFRKFDAVLAIYHDQGLIPFKLLAGFSGVNYTAGLPVVRTSPAHGVAYDIAGKGIANTESFINSIYQAIDIVKVRNENAELNENALPEPKKSTESNKQRH